MLKLITDHKLIVIGIHILLGALIDKRDVISLLLPLVVIGYGVFTIIKNKNQNEEALLLSCYFVGAEVFFRMIKSGISYELGKYAVFLFLILGIFVGKAKQQLNVAFLMYVLLLLLGIVFTQVPEGASIRKAIVFNLSGPILLGVVAFYCYKRPLFKKEVFDGLFLMALPIVAMVSYMYFRTPDLQEMVFGTSSNFKLSGGFGPNQVATTLGLAIFVLAAFILLKVRFTGFLVLDILFLCYFTYRALITFSRGGLIAAALAFIVFSFFMLIHKGAVQNVFKYVFILGLFSVSIWAYTSNITGGMIDNRYQGKDALGRQKDLGSGRGDLIVAQLESFYEAPLFGIGVGNGKFKRQAENANITAASHNEITRLIEEHGLIGVIILLLLLCIPADHFFNSSLYQKAFVSAFIAFWFLTINHSAMRIAFPSFIYGLGLINIISEENHA